MRLWTYITAAVNLAVFLYATPCELMAQKTKESDIRGVRWGMSMAEVEHRETAQVRPDPHPYDSVYKRFGVTKLQYKGTVGEIEAEIEYVFLYNELLRLSYHFQEIEHGVSDALLQKYGKPLPDDEFNYDGMKISKWRTKRTEVSESIYYDSVQEDGEAHFVTYTSLKHFSEWFKVNKKAMDGISKETADDL